MTRSRQAFALALVPALLSAAACAMRSTAAAPAMTVQVTLRVRNNLGTELNLRASTQAAVIWSGSVAANGNQETAVGSLAIGTLISLRATTASGSVVSSRDSIPVRDGLVVWTIP